jgi:carboxypeptidase Taq
MQKELDFEETIKNGRFRELLSWQRDAIHQYGSLYWPKDLVKKITGEPLNPKYFIDYISQKYK